MAATVPPLPRRRALGGPHADYPFDAAIPYDYPASRDVYGVPLGTVKPGDVLRLEAPRHVVVLYGARQRRGDGDGLSAAADAAEDAGAVFERARGTGVPGPDRAQTDEAGVTGSEES